MNNRSVLSTIALLMVGLGRAIAQPRIPDTPAGHTLGMWLDAFNSGDRARMGNFVKTVDPGWNLDGMISFRASTGGFKLLSIEHSAPLRIWFLVQERDSATRAVGDLLVTEGKQPIVEYLRLRALPPGVSPVNVTLDSALRRRVIDGVAADLTQFYVHPEVASQMVAAVRARQKAGAYRDLSDGFQFADRLTSDLRAVSHDLHLQVGFQPFKTPPPGPPTAQQLAGMREQAERGNCGFEKVEILPGNIGYVKFNQFTSPDGCTGTIEAAMAFVAHTDALIFDLRDNHGGAPVTIAFIASYLFDRPTHLNDIYNRPQNSTTQFWTLPSLPGRRLSTQPVFVLTSNHTFSGAEEFCYDLKNLKRATIVGETTGGGAHPVNGYIVADYFQVVVPISEAINPITHTNWEGTGVLPDVKVPAANALNVAEQLATKDIQAATANSGPTGGEEPTRTAPSPGTEANLRRQIEGWEKGRPDYGDMGPDLQEAAMQQRVQIKGMFTRLGALKSLTFARVAISGWDVYDAKFAHGRLQWNIEPLSANGRTNGVFFRRAPLTGKR
jgi:retinol-binding protein 3